MMALEPEVVALGLACCVELELDDRELGLVNLLELKLEIELYAKPETMAMELDIALVELASCVGLELVDRALELVSLLELELDLELELG